MMFEFIPSASNIILSNLKFQLEMSLNLAEWFWKHSTCPRTNILNRSISVNDVSTCSFINWCQCEGRNIFSFQNYEENTDPYHSVTNLMSAAFNTKRIIAIIILLMGSFHCDGMNNINIILINKLTKAFRYSFRAAFHFVRWTNAICASLPAFLHHFTELFMTSSINGCYRSSCFFSCHLY